MPAAGKGARGKEKKKRKRAAKGGGQASDYFDIYGPDARADVVVQVTKRRASHGD